MAKKDTHVTKDGRTVKKGLYYYMNQAKKKGTSKKGKGTVTDKALRESAKTAKKPKKKKRVAKWLSPGGIQLRLLLVQGLTIARLSLAQA